MLKKILSCHTALIEIKTCAYTVHTFNVLNVCSIIEEYIYRSSTLYFQPYSKTGTESALFINLHLHFTISVFHFQFPCFQLSFTIFDNIITDNDLKQEDI